MSEQIFLISYLLENQPMHIEVASDSQSMDVAEARRQIEARHDSIDCATLSDIQVSKVTRTHAPGTTPAHYKQP